MVDSVLICPGCDTEVDKLVRHHWNDTNGELYIKEICFVCNSLLGPAELWEDWNSQLHYLKEYYARRPRSGAETGAISMFQLKNEKRKVASDYIRHHPELNIGLWLPRLSEISKRFKRGGLTPREATHLEELEKHPRKNKQAWLDFIVKVIEPRIKRKRRGRIIRSISNKYNVKLPSTIPLDELAYYYANSVRRKETQRVLNSVRYYMKEHPEEVAAIRERVGVK